jgi:deoxyribonuclease-4
MRIGAHESIAGGLHLAFARAEADRAESLQIFTKSGRQWAGKPISDDDAALFRAEARRTGLPVIAHASYLLNLAAPEGEVRVKSVAAFREELERCERLGIPWLVLHPGAHADEAEGIAQAVKAVRQALDETRGLRAGVCLEITAGQGTCIGHRFEHLARLLEGIDAPERTGVCLDTCHLYAAGYDIGTDEGYEETVAAFDRTVGIARVRAMHLNDAKKGLGCRVDRHDHIGDGTLGEATFARLLSDPRWPDVPAVLETPEGRWAQEIALLKALRSAAPQTGARPRKPPRPAARTSKPPTSPKPAKPKTTHKSSRHARSD